VASALSFAQNSPSSELRGQRSVVPSGRPIHYLAAAESHAGNAMVLRDLLKVLLDRGAAL